MKIFYIILFSVLLLPTSTNAQYSNSKNAQYLAVIKAVANYKIDDEEELSHVEKLRENDNFNHKLKNMMAKLSNTRNKDSKNRRILQILEEAGKEIYDILE
ncbi:MAG: hypothetical protein J6Y53_05600 [Alphaproteobacteria bacterium]|nr:hypothetical protein [Alphaproteobacteria bacterium]